MSLRNHVNTKKKHHPKQNLFIYLYFMIDNDDEGEEDEVYDISSEDAELLGVEMGVISKSALQNRLNLLYVVYHDPRYAPRDANATWREIVRVMGTYDRLLEPEPISRYVPYYCGTSYVLPNEVVGSGEICYRKGTRQGDRHGSQHAKFP